MPKTHKKELPADGKVTTAWGIFTITLMDGKPTLVCEKHLPWWDFARDHEGFEGSALYMPFDREYYIVLVTHAREVANVIPIADLPERYYTAAGVLMGGRGALAIARLKDVFAKQLGYTPLFTEEELKILDANDPPQRQIHSRRYR